jgi:CHAT domain-containing protein
VRASPILIVLLASAGMAPGYAQTQPPSLRDSFALGSEGGVLCQVQTRGRDAALGAIFDRAWSVVCRDAARPVGKLYALRGTPEAIAARLAPLRAGEARCDTPAVTARIEDLGGVDQLDCRLEGADVGYRAYSYRRGNTVWVAEGLAGYDDALKLGLRTIVADRIVPGKIEVATTSVNDPVAFARVQAGALDADQALAEGYRRNNSGDYAEAAEFFGALQARGDATPDRAGEYLINEALQKSNLGQFAEADRLFAEAERLPTSDRVQVRLRRNFQALHLINQQRLDDALAVLDRPIVPLPDGMRVIGGAIEIGRQVAAEINSGSPTGERLGSSEAGTLTPEERAVILDAQALQLRGTILRLQGQNAPARAALERAGAQALSVRNGRVVSIIRLRAQILAETAAAAEAEGDQTRAEALFRDAILLLEQRYPETMVVDAAKARLAAFLTRRGRTDEALALYRTVIDSAARNGGSTAGMTNLVAPYFAALVERAPANPALADDFFVATQTLVRPGVADTQAQLARQLSRGAGDAAALFRQAIALQREVERTRITLAQMRSAEQPDRAQIDTAAADLDRLTREQAAMQARLSAFPQYRALATDTISLSDLRETLRPDEAYLKLAQVGPTLYGLWITKTDAVPYRLAIGADELERAVDDLRATISTVDNGELVTYPFDLGLARQLYVTLTGPVAERVAAARYLTFEPDGAMLKLPIDLLPVAQASVDAYLARKAKRGGDAFDFRGVEWLGRKTAISTSLSARGFRDARRATPSAAGRQYLGFGENAPAFTRVSLGPQTDEDCAWPLAEWNKPVSAAELRQAQAALGVGTDIVTRGAFTDEAVIARPDLANYRIVHFATHGFVTAPRAQCPARPALLTSFGSARSDGLLSFREIYDLKMDADLVILSACDTAGRADVRATREAGVTTGGGSALDGLVRAFIGAGTRAVIASHWPAPDEYNATERLVAGMFEGGRGVAVADALGAARKRLMDDAETSHPFYWAGFAIVGDGTQPLLRTQ